MTPQAYDFRDESDALYKLMAPVSEADYDTETLFKGWTLNDILAHLHLFNYFADLSLVDDRRFAREFADLEALWHKGVTMTESADQLLGGQKGQALLSTWHNYYTEMTDRFADADPKKRVNWAGPDMSVLSSISARLMETWAHAQAIYDVLGVERLNTDRIKSIAVMGINTFGWTFKNRGEDVPPDVPYVRLTAPSGATWAWNDVLQENFIEGSAVEFCQVVTQTRNIGDTQLDVKGDTASRWMATAQCFAGPPRNPPAPGTRSSVQRT